MPITPMKRFISSFSVCLSLFLAGCGTNIGFPGVYRINVEQGNIVTADMVEQLAPGMTRRQVRFILGTPLIEDTFHEHRWDYRYTLRNGLETVQENRLTVFLTAMSWSRSPAHCCQTGHKAKSRPPPSSKGAAK